MTEQYIKMCRHELIQAKWEPKRGDIVLYINNTLGISWVDGGIFCACFDRNFIMQGTDKNDYLWLPRQEDIQEMLYKAMDVSSDPETASPWFWIGVFMDWLFPEEHDPRHEAQVYQMSCDEMWLAFYMHEVHQLEWKGDKWG